MIDLVTRKIKKPPLLRTWWAKLRGRHISQYTIVEDEIGETYYQEGLFEEITAACVEEVRLTRNDD